MFNKRLTHPLPFNIFFVGHDGSINMVGHSGSPDGPSASILLQRLKNSLSREKSPSLRFVK